MNLANKLTILRIALIIPFVILMTQDSLLFWIAALIIFITASLTDYFDGKIARERKEITKIGKLLDPLADKLFITSSLVILATIDKLDIPAWAVIIIISREFIVSGLRTLAAAEGKILAASMSGKIKTAFQMIAIAAILMTLILNRFHKSSYYIVVATAIVSLYSGITYILQNKALLIKADKNQE